MKLGRIVAPAFAALLLLACGGSSTPSGENSADIKGAPETVLRGELAKGQSEPVMIVVKQGAEDAERVDVDMAKTKLAGAELQLLDVFAHKEFWIRGPLERRQVGSVGGSTISRDFLVADTVATVQKDKASGDGVLRKTGGKFLVEVKTGTGSNSDDGGSFALDVSGLKGNVESLIGKPVHVEGLLVSQITGVVQQKFFVSSDLMIASSIR